MGKANMAVGGAKRKDAALHIIEGTRNATKHGTAEDLQQTVAETKLYGKLVKPRWLKGEASRIWDQMIIPAWWLDGSRYVLATAFCLLWQEFRKEQEDFTVGKHAQLRYYMQELGITDARNRNVKHGEEKADEFFDK
jgi:hypothetical protein